MHCRKLATEGYYSLSTCSERGVGSARRLKVPQVVVSESWAWLISEEISQYMGGDDCDKINKTN